MARTYDWEFPLPRTHTGMLLGNGTFGAMVWGESGVLRVTVARADFWDHRGGLSWDGRQSYANIRRCLAAGDEAGLRALFQRPDPAPGEPAHPTVLPMGRVELDFGRGAHLTTGTLNLDEGVATVRIRRGRRELTVRIALDMEHPALCVQVPAALMPKKVRCRPAWEDVGGQLASISFEPPEMLGTDRSDRTDQTDQGRGGPAAHERGARAAALSGWTQMRPADPTLCVAWRQEGRELALAAEYGPDAEAARSAAGKTVAGALRAGFDAMRKRIARWWAQYWRGAARVELPNAGLQFIHDYGMYKFAGLTNPNGVPATLQGPWIEEYQLPPWSSDYHFNINVQMCYWPAYHGNRPEHLRPLWEMLRSWLGVLRRNAKVFAGIDDGLMLPHAVDDRGTCMGGFWTGSIDHGCTAWIATMMFRYWRYTGDRAFLRDTAWPFMAGAMRVYEEMLERRGDSFVLPVSVSPEYRGAAMNAWGANASFQLACIHRLVEDLQAAAAELGEPARPIWSEIAAKLPKASLIGPAGAEMIALWDGTGLEESHRHHSHLAGIAPFDSLDFGDPAWAGIIQRSVRHWVRTGAGLWSGWCVPWASMICSRMGYADAAELWLEIWRRVFTNEGGGTLHDVHFPGFSVMGHLLGDTKTRKEIMQMDAGMGAVAAVHEMLLHVRRGVSHLFRGCPARWKRVAFADFRTDGAFLVSAARRDGRVGPVTVRSLAGGVFRLANPWPGRDAVVRRQAGKAETLTGDVLEVALPKGQTARICRA